MGAPIFENRLLKYPIQFGSLPEEDGRGGVISKVWLQSSETSKCRLQGSIILLQLLRIIEMVEKDEKSLVPPLNLWEQDKLLRETIKKHPQDKPKDVPF